VLGRFSRPDGRDVRGRPLHQRRERAGRGALFDRRRRRRLGRAAIAPLRVRAAPVAEVERLQRRCERHHDLDDEPERDQLGETSRHKSRHGDTRRVPRRDDCDVDAVHGSFEVSDSVEFRQNRILTRESYISVSEKNRGRRALIFLRSCSDHFCAGESTGATRMSPRTTVSTKQSSVKTGTSRNKSRNLAEGRDRHASVLNL